MSNETEAQGVELASEGKAKKIFEHGFSYVRRNLPSKNQGKVLGLVALLIVTIVALTKGTPQKEESTDAGSASIPDMGASQIDPTTGSYSRGEDAKQFDNKKVGRSAKNIKLSGPSLISRPKNIKIPPGTIARAILVTGASNGLIKAELKDDVKVNGETQIDAGSTIMGRGSSTEDRLFVSFTKVVHKDSDISAIEAEAADSSDKTLGLKGSKVAAHLVRVGANIGLKFLAGASEALQDTQGQQGAVITKPTLRNAILHGTAQAALEESNDIASQYKNSPPVIEVPQGTEIYIMFSDGGN